MNIICQKLPFHLIKNDANCKVLNEKFRESTSPRKVVHTPRKKEVQFLIFGMDPFGGLGGRYGLRSGRTVLFLRKSFHSILRRLRTSVRKEEKDESASTRPVGFAAGKKSM